MIIYDLSTMQICDIHEKTVVALGTFDGCHAGHMQVFAGCRELACERKAKSAVYTFSSLPKSPKSGTLCLFSLSERIKAIRGAGIDFLCIEDFESVSEMSGQDFLNDILVSKLHAVGACCGFNFRFGKNASLGASDLENFFKSLGGCVRICDKIDYKGEVLSSSLLRAFVEKGEVEELLNVCQPYSIYSVVEHGKELGRTIGIPTINQKIPSEKVAPARGVYITECEIGEDVFPSVTNVGVRPTVESDGMQNMETFIIGFNGSLYGSSVKVNFYKLLRAEKKFSSIEELKSEIEANVQSAIDYFSH